MALSLRDIVHKRYGIAGRFTLRGDILGKLDHDINFRTPEGKVSLLLILTPPLEATIVSFNASVAQGTGYVTLTWHVKPATPWLAQNTLVGLWHEPGFVFLPLTGFDLPLSGSHGDPPNLGTTTYRLIAWVKVQGGSIETTQDVSVLITQQGPTVSPSTPSAPPSMSGVSKVQLYNCNSDQRTVTVWLLDVGTGAMTPYGPFPPQYDASGGCPGDASPLVVSFPSPGRQYQVVAVDIGLLNCPGLDDPANPNCQRWMGTFTSAADGSVFTYTIS